MQLQLQIRALHPHGGARDPEQLPRGKWVANMLFAIQKVRKLQPRKVKWLGLQIRVSCYPDFLAASNPRQIHKSATETRRRTREQGGHFCFPFVPWAA